MVKFKKFNIESFVIKALLEKKITKPTEIQEKMIPAILQQEDVIACAKTGSGKTYAFLIPIISQLKSKSQEVGIRSLILVPTRELALQTATVVKQLIKFSNLQYSLIIGGHDYTGQFESLACNPDIVIATPGRLLELMLSTQFQFKALKFLVLDEADNLMEKQHKEYVYQIIEHCNKNRTTILLSATIPETLQEFSAVGMREYQLIRLSSEYQLSDQTYMHLFEISSEQKVSLLIYLLQQILWKKEQAIIFVSTKYTVDYLEAILNEIVLQKGSYLYSKMDAEARTIALQNFRENQSKFLVVTDLCARGIDIPNVKYVVNYDFPSQMKTFIHWCGRTARADQQGTVYSFFTPQERPYVYELQQKTSRKLIMQTNQEEYGSLIFGSVPFDQFAEINQQLISLEKKVNQVSQLKKYVKNASIKFEKSRFSFSKDSYDKSKEIISVPTHFFFRSQNQDGLDIRNQIRNFKPQVTLMELKDLSHNPNSEKILKSLEFLKKQKTQMNFNTQKNQEEKDEQILQEELIHQESSQIQLKPFKRNFLISDEANPEKIVTNFKQKKINKDNVEKVRVEDNNRDLFKRQKQVWDHKTKRFKKITLNENNDAFNNNLKMETGTVKKRFDFWKRQSGIKFQQEGTQVNEQQIERMKSSFKQRKREHFKPKQQTGLKGKFQETNKFQQVKNLKQKQFLKKINKQKKPK